MAKWSEQQKIQRRLMFREIGDLITAINADNEGSHKKIYNVDTEEDPRWKKVRQLGRKIDEMKAAGDMSPIERQKYELACCGLSQRGRRVTDLILEGYSAEEIAQTLNMQRASVVKLATSYNLPIVPTFKYKAVPFNKRKKPVYATSIAGINWVVRGVHVSARNVALLTKAGYRLHEGEWHWQDIRIGERFSVSNSSPTFTKESETVFFDNTDLQTALRTHWKR